jgi:hypothetical protein
MLNQQTTNDAYKKNHQTEINSNESEFNKLQQNNIIQISLK